MRGLRDRGVIDPSRNEDDFPRSNTQLQMRNQYYEPLPFEEQ